MGQRLLRCVVVLAVAAPAAPAAAAQPGGPVVQRERAPERVIIRFASGVTASERGAARRDAGVRRLEGLPLPGTEVAAPTAGTSVREAVAELEGSDDVAYAEPDAHRRAFRELDDPLFGAQYALRNTGQTVGGISGTPRADIRANAAWDATTGGEVLVAVVDTGIDLGHPSLVGNLWRNPGESGQGREGNGVDDDGSGIADDVVGADLIEDGAQPYDKNGHGTHVAGTVAAPGNDGLGTTGVAWRALLAAVRVLDAEGSGRTSDVIEAYGYADRIGARVVNLSLGGASPSRAEREALAAADDVLFVVAAGNDGLDLDRAESYPCEYDLPNVICVGASDQNDRLAAFSNFGSTVDLAAPGTNIASTWPLGRHVLLDGTSMAAPHVTGAAVLALARDPALTPAALARLLRDTAEPRPGLADRVATGGRLDAAALVAAVPAPAGAQAPPSEGTGTQPPPDAPQPEPLVPSLQQPEGPAEQPPPASPAPAGTVEPQPASGAAAADQHAPGVHVVTARAIRRTTLTRRGLAVSVRCSEPCRVRAELHAGGRRLGFVTARRRSAGTLRSTLRPRGRIRTGRATLRITATDPADNRTLRRVALRIRG